jgi:phosphoglycolate phosphatase
MAPFAHVIFDLDGTLIDTKADLAAATNAMLATFAVPPLSLAQVTGYIGNGVRVLVERALGPTRSHLVAQGFVVFMSYYEAHLLDQTRPYCGIRQMLTTVRQHGIMMSILTNKPEAASRTILAGLGLSDFFTAIIGGDTLAVRKPAPQGVFHLQQQSGIPGMGTLLVGDSRIDIDTGHAAGVLTCAVTWGFDDPRRGEQPPHFVVHSPEALAELLVT